MQFSEQWLRQWVNPPIDTDALATRLTMAGLEVDAITPVAGTFSGVLVGEVRAVAAHPNADKLHVCEVDTGADAPLSIVCGAANVRVGLHVPVAVVGALLPGGMKIRTAKLRGVASSGMLCSACELGLAEHSEGLLELPPEAPVGSDIRTYLDLDDVSIELGLTPNRGDCLSIAGVAREVGVLCRMALTPPGVEPVEATIEDRMSVRLSAPEDCPRYVGRVIRAVDARAATPLWMRERLRRCGVRSRGPLVDVTNYVLLELGQPMHAFDLARLEGALTVRRAEAGEALVLLDGQHIELQPGSLLICDESGPQALAGIMGGAASAVGDATRDVFLESAFFTPGAIAGRARAYGLHTDASHRFERGVSPSLAREAMERATRLLLDITGGRPGPVVEVSDAAHLPVRAPVCLRYRRIARVLGQTLPQQEVTDILEHLGLALEASGEGDARQWQVTPPAFRFDIEREEDLIEEIARIHGYDAIEIRRPSSVLSMPACPERRVTLRRIRTLLVDRGYQEAITYSFVDPALQTRFSPELSPIPLANPLSMDLSVMRTSLWPGLIQALQHNMNRQQDRVRLFESGLRFIQQDNEIKQENMISGIATGTPWPEQWGEKSRSVDYFDVKGDIEALLGLTGDARNYIFNKKKHPALHPGQSAAIHLDGEQVGWIGTLHPTLERELDISQNTVLFEINLSALEHARLPVFRSLSKYPAIRRDIAVIVDEAVSAQQIQDCVHGVAPAVLRDIQLFDIYTGKGIDSGRKSLAIGLTLQEISRTLTDSEVDDIVANVIETLRSGLGAALRE